MSGTVQGGYKAEDELCFSAKTISEPEDDCLKEQSEKIHMRMNRRNAERKKREGIEVSSI
jgi:hypothetical protein